MYIHGMFMVCLKIFHDTSGDCFWHIPCSTYSSRIVYQGFKRMRKKHDRKGLKQWMNIWWWPIKVWVNLGYFSTWICCLDTCLNLTRAKWMFYRFYQDDCGGPMMSHVLVCSVSSSSSKHRDVLKICVKSVFQRLLINEHIHSFWELHDPMVLKVDGIDGISWIKKASRCTPWAASWFRDGWWWVCLKK